ncbi:YkyA family protein [Oceanobacillus chungangensis]|nr:YkyA family protein [Oceanobacillus chungangensis]
MKWNGSILIGFAMMLFIVFLSACSGESTQVQIHNHLEEAVNLEEVFESQQENITELETQEQEIYSQIIDLGMDEFEQIVELAKEATGIIDERADKIKLEKESIDASREEFNKIRPLIDELEDGELKQVADKMYAMMEKRYNSYDKLHEAYLQSLKQEKELYSLLQQEDLEQETLTEQINKINESYQKILDENQNFNEFTTEYNKLKKEFYTQANMNVSYESE